MMRYRAWLSLFLLGSLPALAAAPSWYAVPFGGYASQMRFTRAEPASGDITADGGGLLGLAIGRTTDDPGAMELLFSQQRSRLSPSQPDDLTIRYLHFAGALIRQEGLRPYLSAGVGLTHLSAYRQLTRPSLALAVGLQPQLSEQLALRAELRGYGTLIQDDSSFLCDPDRCQFKLSGDLATQLQANLGLLWRF